MVERKKKWGFCRFCCPSVVSDTLLFVVVTVVTAEGKKTAGGCSPRSDDVGAKEERAFCYQVSPVM